MEKHQFKSFDKVLIRDNEDQHWKATLFSYYDENKCEEYPYVTVSGPYAHCIPYNENTAYLLGTCKPYKEPEPKVWKVTCHKTNEVLHFTNDDLKHFIENAVINNRDIQWLTITYDENN